MRPVTTLPDGVDLTTVFFAIWPHLDPALRREALDILEDEQRQLGRPELFAFPTAALDPESLQQRREHEALVQIWEEDVPLEDPMVRAYLRGLPGAESAVSRARLELEVRVRKILVAIAERLRAGVWKLTATDPKTHQRFEPDPTMLENLIGSDRSRGQITTDAGVLRNVRVVMTPEPDPKQPEFLLPGSVWRPAKYRRGTALDVVLGKMREDGLAKIEDMKAVERAKHYATSDRTARRALAKLREEQQSRQADADEPPKTDK
jgi:hypothetical protein